VTERAGPHPRLEALRARRERHAQRGRLYRFGFALAGFVVLAVGLVMVVTPGPAAVVIPIGLAMLALEFAWAEHLLDRALHRFDDVKEASRPRQALVIAVGAAVALAVAAVVFFWDVPLLPI